MGVHRDANRGVAAVEVGQGPRGIGVTADQVSAPGQIHAHDAAVLQVALARVGRNAIQLAAEVEHVVVILARVIFPAVDERDHHRAMPGAPVGVVDGVQGLVQLAFVPEVAIVLEFHERE